MQMVLCLSIYFYLFNKWKRQTNGSYDGPLSHSFSNLFEKSGICLKSFLSAVKHLYTVSFWLLSSCLSWLCPVVSISSCLPEGVRGLYQNGCLSAADLKWGYDGDISGHVCENTITSMSRLNHSPLCDDFPPALLPPSPPVLISPVHVLAVYHSRRGETHRAVMDGPGAKNSPNSISITHQHPLGWIPASTTPHPSQWDKVQMQM